MKGSRGAGALTGFQNRCDAVEEKEIVMKGSMILGKNNYWEEENKRRRRKGRRMRRKEKVRKTR